MTNSFSAYSPTWCPGCGNWGIGEALKAALTQSGHNPSSVFLVFGIGCSGNMNDFVNAYTIHALHGRAIPNAIGIKLAKHKLPVVVIAGDGDLYGEGGNHFLHACRGNHNIAVIAHDNRLYGLTTGQVSPTAQKGQKSKSTPGGIIERPLNPLTLALTQGATFVAQAFAGDITQLIQIIRAALNHNGFSLINVLQPCVTFNKKNTYEYYLKRVYKLDQKYDPTNYTLALQKAEESLNEKFPLGILYKDIKPNYHQQLKQLSKETALVDKPRFKNFAILLKEFA